MLVRPKNPLTDADRALPFWMVDLFHFPKVCHDAVPFPLVGPLVGLAQALGRLGHLARLGRTPGAGGLAANRGLATESGAAGTALWEARAGAAGLRGPGKPDAADHGPL